MDTHRIVHIASNETERIVVAQVLLRSEWYLAQVIKTIDGISRDAQVTQTFLIERRLQAYIDCILQFLYLQLAKLLSWHRL